LHQPKPQIATPDTSQENHTADFPVPMKRPHEHTKPTNQPTNHSSQEIIH
jgi:hypothetical protein